MTHRLLRRLCIPLTSLLAGLLGMASCQLREAQTAAPSTRPFIALDQIKLHNAHQVTSKVYSGAQPEGDEAFKELARLGVKTIISVDGAAPDAQTARKYGMRYVHLPIGYDSVPQEKAWAISKAITELPGPVYIHCHHGKHRSAAAVAVACVMNGTLDPSRADEVLKTFGTGANYTGLWQSARDARPVDASKLHALKVDFVERVQIPPIAEAMVHVDERAEHLKLSQAAGWKAPPENPDVSPPHEALQLQELLAELDRSEAAQAKPAQFRELMSDAVGKVTALRSALVAQPFDSAAADNAMKAAMASCTACHKAYRD